MDIASFGKKFRFGETPKFHDFIEVSLDVASAWKAFVADAETGEFCQVIVCGVTCEEAADGLAIAAPLGMLLVFGGGFGCWGHGRIGDRNPQILGQRWADENDQCPELCPEDRCEKSEDALSS
jgi:hypothetical protein